MMVSSIKTIFYQSLILSLLGKLMRSVLTQYCSMKKSISIFIVFIFISTSAFAAVPGVPSLSVPGSDSDGSYSVSWGSVSNATRYELVGEMSGTLYSGTGRSLGRNKSNGTYYYKVRACNSSGCSAYSGKKGITVNITPIPGVPSVSVPGSDADGSYSVSWSSVAYATRYELLGEQSGVIYNGSGTSVNRNKSNGTYYYMVRACNSSGCGGYSAKKGITVNITPIPAVPSITVPSSDTDGSYNISWSSVAYATRYELLGELSGVLYNGAGTSINRNKGNGTYYYMVRACNASGCSGYSTKKGINVNIPPVPGVPSISASLSGGDDITVSWNAVANASHYYRQVSIDNGSWINRNKYTSTSVLFSNQQVRSYRYRVQACNINEVCSAYSVASNTITVLPVPAVPSVTASLSNGDDITVSWNGVSGANHYYYETSKNGGVWQNDTKHFTTSVQFTDQPEGSYRYRVRACNANNICSQSGEITNAISIVHPPMLVKRFEWLPNPAYVGQKTTFYWDIENADKCYSVSAGSDPTKALAPSGNNGQHIYTEPGQFLTQWYCVDQFGNRIPENPNNYLEFTRTISPPPPMSVNRFEWLPKRVRVGEQVTFYWDVNNADKCYAVSNGANTVDAKAGSGEAGPYIYNEPGEHLTQWYCLDAYGNRYPQNENEFIETTRYVDPPVMKVNRFEWQPNPAYVGQETTFYWEVENADKCYSASEGSDPTKALAPSGNNGQHIYTEPGQFLTKWYCVDQYGNRIPENPNNYLEFTRTINPAPPMSVNRFEWLPERVKVGEQVRFYWDIENADKCYAVSNGANTVDAKASSGETVPYIYNEAGEHLTQWYCLDVYGNRFPQDESEFIETFRYVDGSIKNISTELLGAAVSQNQ